MSDWLLITFSLGVVFVPCDSRQPIRYLLTMHKHDNIKKVKEKLLELIKEESCDLVIAEVFDNHIARILVSFHRFIVFALFLRVFINHKNI